MEEWKDPEQVLTHPGKYFPQHVQEVMWLSERFLEYCSMPESSYKIVKYLARYHDIGKTHTSWELGKKTPHSPHSFRYVMGKRKMFDNDVKITWLLWYLILKHHSSLTDTFPPTLENRIRISREIRRALIDDYEKIINLVDAFGLFKLADVCSADNNLDFQFNPPVTDESVVRAIIGINNVDNARLETQRKILTGSPDIAMLRAHTGWGKTDVCTLFFENRKCSRIFYLFPTITAINKFHEKLTLAVKNKKLEVSKYFYFSLASTKNEDIERIDHLFYVKNFTAPYIITTVDQFLLTFLQVGKYYVRRPMFRNSGLVIDEVHLLTPLMLNLLTFFIRKYQPLYKFKVLFMSATFPKALASYLTHELNLPPNSELDFSDQYKQKRRVMWNVSSEKIETLLTDLSSKNVLKDKKVLIVTNTVQKAINIARLLEDELEIEYGKQFNIIHSRFMYEHREKKEEWLDKMKNVPHYLVSTQVCEVSLDISYDLLITECASVPALVQRFGRTNRKGSFVYIPNVYIAKEDISAKKYPYSDEELALAWKMAKEFEGEKLKNEMLMLEYLDSEFTEEKLRKSIEQEKSAIDLEAWEKCLNYFFSLSVAEEPLKNLLNYREGQQIHVIPDPKCIREQITKNKVTSLLHQYKKVSELSYGERMRLLREVMRVTVPIPWWWVDNIQEVPQLFGIPVVDLSDKNHIYGEKYGFE